MRRPCGFWQRGKVDLFQPINHINDRLNTSDFAVLIKFQKFAPPQAQWHVTGGDNTKVRNLFCMQISGATNPITAICSPIRTSIRNAAHQDMRFTVNLIKGTVKGGNKGRDIIRRGSCINKRRKAIPTQIVRKERLDIRRRFRGPIKGTPKRDCGVFIALVQLTHSAASP